MYTALVLVLVGIGVIVLAGGVVLLLLLVMRSRNRHAATVMSAPEAREALQRRGWTFAERDDSWIPVYDRQHDRRGWSQPLQQPPRALAASDVVTGAHRGRPFVAATFNTVFAGKRSRELAIWVLAPAAHPMLSAMRIVGPQNAINRGLGRGGVQFDDREFDAGFEVVCDDEAFARAALGPELRAFLLRDGRSFRGIAFRGEYVDAFDAVSDHRDPVQLERALDLRCDVLDRVAMWNRQS